VRDTLVMKDDSITITPTAPVGTATKAESYAVKDLTYSLDGRTETLTLDRNLTLPSGVTLPAAYPKGTAFTVWSKFRSSGVFVSETGGASWTSMGKPGDLDGGVSAGGQALNNFSFLADKTNADVVYVGGDTHPDYPNNAGAVSWSGRLFRGERDALGTRWTPITDDYANNTAPHSDSREMVFDANGNILQSDDGGLYRLKNPTSNADRIWESANGNLRATELVSVDWTRRAAACSARRGP
jgi:hypothetical protein